VTKPPRDDDSPEKPDNGSGDGNQPDHETHYGTPPTQKGRPLKIMISQSAQETKFADLFGFTLTPTHAVIKFGNLQPETGEFIVHTQIAMTPQGLMALSEGLRQNIEKARKMKPGPGPGSGSTMN
jgi:hypothetical protein